ncbi:hypothetical protein ACFQ61_21505 [Streptomyces sp. NPDC056500]|uniref:hypothetical protein n=1 Tax=Streptomyces sp. NPDC056500 TaxID=3345840 RepID=UPI0036B77117
MTTIHIVDLDESGWLLDGGEPVAADRLDEHFAAVLTPPSWASDIIVYVHGWQTAPDAAAAAANRLLALADEQYESRRALYPALAARFAPWLVLLRWPSRSGPHLGGYRRIRDRAHALSGESGHAGRVIGQLLGYLDSQRADPVAAPVLANRAGQYLHLVGHSFGCRVLCEAVQWAADDRPGGTLGWSRPGPAGRAFTVDSMLLLQMAAPRDAFATTFTALADAPLRGPVVATYAERDWATGLWHRIAEQRRGIGSQGIGTAPEPVSSIRMRPASEAYDLTALDHWFVSVDAGAVFTAGRGPSGSHSDHLRAETAHLLLSLANHSR